MINQKPLTYELKYKQVKNINLRIKSDGTIHVSANKRISQKRIDGFILSKASFISRALERLEQRTNRPQKQYFEEEKIREVIQSFCKKVYPYYESRGIQYPQIKFRKMVSCWGSCHASKGILTFNTNLMYAPRECIEYVVWHEFTHFLQPNHSPAFYDELERVCPNWKAGRKKLKEIQVG